MPIRKCGVRPSLRATVGRTSVAHPAAAGTTGAGATAASSAASSSSASDHRRCQRGGDRPSAKPGCGHRQSFSAETRRSLGARRVVLAIWAVMFRVSVGVATVAVVLGLAGGARAQRTPTPPPRAAAPADPSDTWDKHMSLGLDMGPGGVISAYTRNSQPQRPAVLHVAARDVRHQDAVGGRPHAARMVPARVEPGDDVRPHRRAGSRRATTSAACSSRPRWGSTSTKYAWTFGFDVGGGIEWDIPDAPGFAIGPYLRYGAVINADSRTRHRRDAWTVGGSFTYHFGRAAAGARPGAGPRRTGGGAYKVSVPDSDRDGIGDDQDLCRDQPQGKHPDPFRPGCPENDEDGDGIPDADDPCPVTAPGATPDPNRAGCPFTDSDNDGVGDSEDACPGKPGVFSPDPTHSGCPGKKKRPPRRRGKRRSRPSRSTRRRRSRSAA